MQLSPRETSDLRPGELIAGRFRLERPLSQGGMGCVWVAFHTTLGIEVAIKFVDVDGDARAEALRRFEREANVVARLRSSHVVQILDYGVDEAQRAYIVMELLHGESLRDRLKRTHVLPFDIAARVVMQCCRALHRAHKAGVVHRDIKPANIFLCDEDDGLLVKVLDFGIAKATAITGSDHQSTATGAIVGTPAYMSPEQARGSTPLDGRSDLFSLAIVAWRSIVGRHPHEPDGKPLGLGELLIAITTRPVIAPSTLAPGLSPEVDAWFANALALDVSKRFESAKAMADALAVAAHLPTGNASTTGQTGVATSNLAFATSGDNPLFDSDQNVAMTPPEMRARATAAETSGTGRRNVTPPASDASSTIASTPTAKASASGAHLAVDIARATAVTRPRTGLVGAVVAAVLLGALGLVALRSSAPVADAARTPPRALEAPPAAPEPTAREPAPTGAPSADAPSSVAAEPRAPSALPAPPAPSAHATPTSTSPQPRPIAPRTTASPPASARPAASANPKSNLLDDRL